MNSYKAFERQLAEICSTYPNLKIKTQGALQYLHGLLDVCDEQGQHIQSFLIEIRHQNGFPYRFPLLLEIGGFIPCSEDWHKASNNSCCITVPLEEALHCKHGITLSVFIKKHVIPYLAHQYYRKHFGKYEHEYKHGEDGLIEAYGETLKIPDLNIIIKCLEYVLGKKCPRNELCPCGSNVKHKRCHLVIFEMLRALPKKIIQADYERMKQCLYEK